MDKKKSLLPLWILLGVFAAPALASIIIHLLNKGGTLATIQNGVFIQQPFYLDTTQADNTAGKNWNLVFVEPNICDSSCLERRRVLNNIQKALGRDQKRVKILAIQNQELVKQTDLFAPKSVIILNPQGLAIMHYDPNANPSGILKDVRKLLKNSHV
jgi:hypothetical protein